MLYLLNYIKSKISSCLCNLQQTVCDAYHIPSNQSVLLFHNKTVFFPFSLYEKVFQIGWRCCFYHISPICVNFNLRTECGWEGETTGEMVSQQAENRRPEWWCLREMSKVPHFNKSPRKFPVESKITFTMFQKHGAANKQGVSSCKHARAAPLLFLGQLLLPLPFSLCLNPDISLYLSGINLVT